jgi:2-dehydrotetronate isomerase
LHVLKFSANLNWLFMDVPLLERFERAAAAGFKAVEIIDPYEAKASEIAAALRANGLTLALINIAPGKEGERGLTAIPGREQEFEAALGDALNYAEATGCRRIHLLPGLLHHGAQRPTYVANLRKAARTAAPSGIDVLIEPINRRDIPGFFINKTHEARAVIHEVGEANLGLQFDLYHRQVEEGDVAMGIREFGPLARHYQVANPPDRGEPDEGEMNYATIFKLIDASGFDGYVGCEYRPRRDTVEGLKWAARCGVTLA